METKRKTSDYEYLEILIFFKVSKTLYLHWWLWAKNAPGELQEEKDRQDVATGAQLSLWQARYGFQTRLWLPYAIYILRSYMFRARKIVSQMIKKPKLNEAEAKVEISPPRPTRRCSCSSPPTWRGRLDEDKMPRSRCTRSASVMARTRKWPRQGRWTRWNSTRRSVGHPST